MAEKNHVQVMIEGKMMTLVGTETPEYMKSVAEYIEEKNKEIRSGENGRRMNVAMASILTSKTVHSRLKLPSLKKSLRHARMNLTNLKRK